MKTVVALYPSEDRARQVETALISAGVPQGHIRVEGGVHQREEQREGGIGGFFRWLFAGDDYVDNNYGDTNTYGDDAGVYAESIRRGDYAVIVQLDDEGTYDTTVENVMYDYDPIDVDSRGEYFRSTGWTGYDASAPVYSSDEIAIDRERFNTTYAASTTTTSTSGMTGMSSESRTLDAGEQARLNVVEEELQVGKRQVQRGGVRVRTFVTERPVSADVTLREEHVTIERHPVNRAATSADLNTFEEGVIEVTETAEEAVVAKTARVVEEVVVGKEATERTETITDTVRRKDVEVETTGTTGTTSSSSTTTTTSSNTYDR